jgi:hypothetical protein
LSSDVIELAKGIEAVQDGRIHIEKINAPFLSKLKATGPDFGADIKHAINQGRPELRVECRPYAGSVGLGRCGKSGEASGAPVYGLASHQSSS